MTLTFLNHLWIGYLSVVVSPFFYVGILLLALQYIRQNRLERQLFGVRVTDWKRQTIRSLGFGIVVGILFSAAVTLLGITIYSDEIIGIWFVSFLLALFNVRWICFSYSGGLISFISLLLQELPRMSGLPNPLEPIYLFFYHFQVAPVLALVAILHLAEAALVGGQGSAGASPVFLAGKRGRVIGGFILQKFWLVPLAVAAVTGSAAPLGAPLWWPLFPAALVQGLQIVPMPAVLGFSGVCVSSSPKEKSDRTAKMLAVYSLLLLGLSWTGGFIHPVLWAAAVFSPAAHEWMLWREKRIEMQGSPRYVKSREGLRILSVLPDSPAEAMGLKSEEIIVKVNQVPVSTPFDLHFAIQQNPAFAKLEVMDADGQIRFVQKPLFDGTHHALGLILVPDEAAKEYLDLQEIPIWKQIWRRIGKPIHPMNSRGA